MEDIIRFLLEHIELTIIGAITLVQVAPIKIDPWAHLFTWIQSIVNSDLSKKIDEQGEKINKLSDTVDKIITESGEEKASSCRRRILRFADEIRRNVDHSEEFFDDILMDIKYYEDYCESHPHYKNDKAKTAIKRIRQVYEKCVTNNNFL